MPLLLSVENFTWATIPAHNALFSVVKEQGHYTMFTGEKQWCNVYSYIINGPSWSLRDWAWRLYIPLPEGRGIPPIFGKQGIRSCLPIFLFT